MSEDNLHFFMLLWEQQSSIFFFFIWQQSWQSNCPSPPDGQPKIESECTKQDCSFKSHALHAFALKLSLNSSLQWIKSGLCVNVEPTIQFLVDAWGVCAWYGGAVTAIIWRYVWPCPSGRKKAETDDWWEGREEERAKRAVVRGWEEHGTVVLRWSNDSRNVISIVQSSCLSAGRQECSNRGVTAVFLTKNRKRGDLDLGDTVTLEHV